MRKIISYLTAFTLGLMLWNSDTYGQQEPQFDFFPYVHTFTNPGYTGMGQAICVTTDHRQQWMGFEGNPVTTGLSVTSYLKRISSGVGLLIVSDKLGFENNTHAKLLYSYHVNIGDGTLGIGMALGIKNKTLNPDQWQSYSSLNNVGVNPNEDPAIPHAGQKTVFASSLGAFYMTDYLYAGFGIDNLIQSNISYETGEEYFLKRHYFITAGYYYTLPNPIFELKPSIFISSDGVVNQYTFTGALVYNKSLIAGIGYRYGDSFIFQAGYQFSFNLTVALAYDLSISRLSKYNDGSFELVLNYCFNIKKPNPGVYKSVRFL